MPASFKARSDDGIHGGFFEVLHSLRAWWPYNRDDVFGRHSSKTSLGGIPKMKLNTGTFASINTRA